MRDGVERCWNQTGVGGDGSCPRLAPAGHCRNCDEYSRAGRALLDRDASESLREDWSRLLAQPKPAAGARGDSCIVFEAGGELLALGAVLVERVADARPVHTVPSRSGTLFTGVVNVDGELLPCFSAAQALQAGEDRAASNPGRILVLRHERARLACAVDRVLGFGRLSPADLESPPVTLARYERALTSAVFDWKGKRAGLLDGEKFVERLMNSASL